MIAGIVDYLYNPRFKIVAYSHREIHKDLPFLVYICTCKRRKERTMSVFNVKDNPPKAGIEAYSTSISFSDLEDKQITLRDLMHIFEPFGDAVWDLPINIGAYGNFPIKTIRVSYDPSHTSDKITENSSDSKSYPMEPIKNKIIFEY